MKLAYRVLVFIMTIIFMFVSIVLSFYAFGLAEKEFLTGFFEEVYMQWKYGLLFLIIFFAAASILYPFFSDNRNHKKTLVSSSELGDINITLKAIDNLIKNIVVDREGITDIKTELNSVESGLNINLSLKVFSNYSLPNLTDDLQNEIKKYLEDRAGIEVNKISILIDEVKNNEIKEIDK